MSREEFTIDLARAQPANSPLDDLARLAASDLASVYRYARTPRIADLDGDFEGRMLAVMHAGVMRGFLHWFASRGWFPWKGKSFKRIDADRGEGINRVFSDGKNGRRWFRFETSVTPSRAGSFDAVQLDYDNRDNPFFVRVIKDEVRELAPGLLLGQAYAILGRRPKLVAYFGLRKR